MYKSKIMLNIKSDFNNIDFNNLYKINYDHVIINDVKNKTFSHNNLKDHVGGVNQHNYLTHYKNLFFIMWSDGPGIEDRVGQIVKFSTSTDGLNWAEPKNLSEYPYESDPKSKYYGIRTDKGFRQISRGFWQRENDLLALVAVDEAGEFFGKSLKLFAYKYNSKLNSWEMEGLISENSINNFPPKKVNNNLWMMSRRTYDYKNIGVYFMIGGIKSLSSWEYIKVQFNDLLQAEEPFWWELKDGTLVAMFRDNNKSGFIFRSISYDFGRNWTKPVKTNFPDARSKFYGLHLKNGKYILISNTNQKKRDPLTIAISDDGILFNKIAYLIGNRQVDYPHAIEKNNYLYVAFSGAKQSVELLKFKTSELNKIN